MIISIPKYFAVKIIFFIVLISLFLVGSVSAQSGTSSISGVITDQEGAVVPGVKVTLSNPSKGFRKTKVSDKNGNYNFLSISPNTYKIVVEIKGFKKTVNSRVQALVNSTANFNFKLVAGDVSATVTVNANPIDLIKNTEDARLGHGFVTKQISQLPIDLRTTNNLLTLQAGVTNTGYVFGNRSDQSNITLDGVDINDQQTGGRNGQFDASQGTVLRSTIESLEEFRITTVNPNADQGRSSGAQISLITRSGTNNFHGAAFYFYKPTAFSANDFFNNLAGVERPSLARNLFGGAIGGPIKKDKLFFFYNYEGQRQDLEASVVRTVPLAHMGFGELRFSGTGPNCDANGNCVLTMADLNGIYSNAGINPFAVAEFANAASRYSANDTSVGDGFNTGGFRFNAPLSIRENTHITRLDYNTSEDHQLFFRGNYQWDNSTGASVFPDTVATQAWSHPLGFVIGHNWTISNNVVNTFRYGLTRQAFTNTGDSNENAISFRGVFSPKLFARNQSRVTTTQNFTNDLTWVKNKHIFQFGANVRVIRNNRKTLANAFDSAVTNSSFYINAASEITNAGYTIDDTDVVNNAVTALIGRFSQYTGQFNYDINGDVLPIGTRTERNFATEEYDVYIQDSWKPFRNLTVTGGLRYALSRPVYEQNGFQVVPTVRLGDYFDQRRLSAAQGIPFDTPIEFDLAGPGHDKPGFYSMDWNNLQPAIAVAWSPNYKSGFWKKLFGGEGDSVLRAGFRITNDYFGSQLAVSFDGLSTLGFTTSDTIAFGTYDVTNNLGPRFTGFDQTIRDLPNISAPNRFQTPADGSPRIETSLDSTIKSPIHYTWNVSYGRSLPKGAYFEASYVGRAARNLFSARDIMALNNLVDPASGMDWYTAAGEVYDLRASNTAFDSAPNIAYFDNLFPNASSALQQFIFNVFGSNDPTFDNLTPTQAILYFVGRDGYNSTDWTFLQLILDDAGIVPNAFYHPQYGSFSSYGTTAFSDYHGATFSLRQRLGESLSYDINYTFSKSMDNSSGLQGGDNAQSGFGSAFILNPLRPDDNYSVSDFDVKHIMNANFIFQLPFGKGRTFFNSANSFVDAALGGWQLAGIMRWSSGRPLGAPFDGDQWATNWTVQSRGVRLGNIPLASGGVDRNTRNVFSDPQAAFNLFRNAKAGETGDRNPFRLPGFSTIDLGLSKTFSTPWKETHKLQFRWEVFNVANAQYFTAGNQTRSTYGLGQDPELNSATSSFGQIYNGISGSPRSMQLGLRYSF